MEPDEPVLKTYQSSKNKQSLQMLRDELHTKPSFCLQCCKHKTWKDIAATLGIGASSSGAYTLKKHYGKNLLPFECQFDRGGIDPGPVLAASETKSTSAKKAKAAAAAAAAASNPPPAPSPGSQDSRDSFSNSGEGGSGPPGASGPPGGPGYPGPPGGSYPPGASGPAPGAPGYNNYPPHSGGPEGGRPPSHPGKKNT